MMTTTTTTKPKPTKWVERLTSSSEAAPEHQIVLSRHLGKRDGGSWVQTLDPQCRMKMQNRQ